MIEITIIDQEIDDLYKKIDEGQRKGEMAGSARRFLAYILKGLAGGGSLFVATGLFPEFQQTIGIAILVAIFLDTVSSNHKRLLAIVEAGYAFRALRSRVKAEFNREAARLYKRNEAGDATAESELDDLKQKTHKFMFDEYERIKKMEEAADLEALKSLSLDQERTAVQG